MNRHEFTINLQTPWRMEDDGGMTAPAVLMVPGVHCGNRGCIYYSPDVLKASAPAWEGTPVVIDHPKQEGR